MQRQVYHLDRIDNPESLTASMLCVLKGLVLAIYTDFETIDI